MEQGGADVIELGVPFSDPMADGPIIQRASERALHRGVNAKDCIELVKRIRKRSEVPILLFSYLNPLLSLGLETLGERLQDAGIDGVLGTDLVPEEAGEFKRVMRRSGIDTVFLVAPTSTDERLKLVADSCSGFVYAVSRTGVTGTRQSLSEAVEGLVRRVKRVTDLPVAVGFGVSEPSHVQEVWRHADAAVVGSRIVSEIESLRGETGMVSGVRALVQRLVGATPAVGH
jgi:tryptophan synthase alpha chain